MDQKIEAYLRESEESLKNNRDCLGRYYSSQIKSCRELCGARAECKQETERWKAARGKIRLVQYETGGQDA